MKITELAQRYFGHAIDSPSIGTPIEAGIKPLCDALNDLPGVSTIWSCEGHPERPVRPYVTFVGDRTIAFAVHTALSQGKDKTMLHFCWQLTAHFQGNGSMHYTIETNDYRVLVGTWQRWLASTRWSKEVMKADLSRLAELVAQLKQK